MIPEDTKENSVVGVPKNQSGITSPVADPSPERIGETFSRTFLLKVLIVAYLVLAWFEGVRCYAVFANGDLLATYLSQSKLLYIALSGAVWGLAGLASAAALWFGVSSATWLSRLSALGCFLWYWFDYLFMSQSSFSWTNWPFVLFASLLALAFAWWIPAMPKESKFLHRKSNHNK